MKMVLHVLVVTTIFSVVTLHVEGMISKVNVLPNFGCAHGLKDDLYHFHDLSACKGTWKGHVEHASSLCSNGWHVCSWNDTALLSLVSWYKAIHMHGCYAINAAHDGKTCGECNSDMADMAGVGADCPRQKKNSNSCFGKGKIDANWEGAPEPCSYTRGISGVICCRNRVVGQPPHIIESPSPSLRVRLDENAELTCRATGSPLPHITWFHNGLPVDDESTMKSVLHIDKQKDTTSSTLSIVKSSKQHEGLYSCQAENRHGNAVSYSSSVRVYGDGSNVNACKNIDSQHLISGRSENIAACDGRWKGSVRHAGKQLCAKGWQVCGSRHRHLLNRLSWTDTLQLTGCFALNSATSNNFACTKCSPRQKGNRLSGIGSECGYIDRSQSSCLNKGRIDVWPSSSSSTSTQSNEVVSIQGKKFKPRRTTNSCQYVEGLTTGVMCCKKVKDKKVPVCMPGCEGGGICTSTNKCSCPPDKTGPRCQFDRNANRCSKPCGANSHCTTNGVCKCDPGYKLMNDECIYRGHPVTSQCSETKPCLNGGTCSNGSCICRENYKGEHCETRLYKTMMETLVEQLWAAMGGS